MNAPTAIGVAALLLLGNAFFVGSEFAMISARRSQIENRQPPVCEGGTAARSHPGALVIGTAMRDAAIHATERREVDGTVVSCEDSGDAAHQRVSTGRGCMACAAASKKRRAPSASPWPAILARARSRMADQAGPLNVAASFIDA